MIRSKQSGSSITALSTEHLYDQENRLTQQSYQLGGTGFTETYTYDSTGDGSMTEMTTTNGSTLTLAYDTIRRLQTLTAKNGNSTLYTKGYAYRTISGQQTTTQISALNYSGFANAPSFQYAYNADGTIASESESNNTPRCYSYDKLGQLTFVSDDENDLHYSYNYDSAGNITSVSVQGVYHNWENYNNTYTYGNVRRILLTKARATTAPPGRSQVRRYLAIPSAITMEVAGPSPGRTGGSLPAPANPGQASATPMI